MVLRNRRTLKIYEMKIITALPIIKVTKGVTENVSNARGGGGRMGGARPIGAGRPMMARPIGAGRPIGGGGRHRFGRRHGWGAPIYWGGIALWWNGAYWVDANDNCYEKNWLGQYNRVECSTIPNVALGL